ncbi:hypothetical protein DSO57_1004627 [Entomophthora muscae]|uniref:Uncharacterized protein n=1 Tax=Entomophthora muscae TaxID=34485 RepID=A0ACC2SKX8_9FUNG|nr:hypothetical protein DSO57_1004627 [Entomophthora muscae]
MGHIYEHLLHIMRYVSGHEGTLGCSSNQSVAATLMALSCPDSQGVSTKTHSNIHFVMIHMLSGFAGGTDVSQEENGGLRQDQWSGYGNETGVAPGWCYEMVEKLWLAGE